ncbi:MAG: LCP family protein [Micrococcales bacterium]
MFRRARWLLLLHILVPGSAQLVAGNRRLARIGLMGTLVAWALVLLAALLWFVNRTILIWFFTNSITAFLIAVYLFAAALLYFALSVDTLRHMQLVRVPIQPRRIMAIATIAVTLFGSGTIAYGGSLAGAQSSLLGSVFSQHGTWQADENGRFNILLLGGDAGAHRFGLRPDSISVLSIDSRTGQTVNIGIPRNMQHVKFSDGSPMYSVYPNGWNCGVECLINALYKDVMDNHQDLYPDAVANGSDPGVEATMDAAEYVTGLKIQGYVLVDMAGFEALIDALGGLNIDVKTRLPIGGGEDANGQPINVRGWIEPGMQHMSGHTALWYARSRHGSSDYSRMARQREVEQAMLAQLDPVNVMAHFNSIAKAGEKLVKTNIPSDMISSFVDLALKAKSQGIAAVELVPPKVNVIHPNFSEIRNMIKDAMTPSPSASPTE